VTRLLFNRAGGERVVSFAHGAELLAAGAPLESAGEVVVPIGSAGEKKAA